MPNAFAVVKRTIEPGKKAVESFPAKIASSSNLPTYVPHISNAFPVSFREASLVTVG